jgi:UTP--glucose-1-phosphate uridylyltransferase
VELELELENKGKFDLLQEVRDIGDMIRIFYVRQKLQKGLGDAVYQAKRFINDSPFAVLLADDIIDSTDPVLRQMIDLYRKRPGIILAVTRIPQEEISQWGVIKGKEIGKGTFKVEDMIEKPDPGEAPSDLAIIGRYILTPSIFEAIEKVSPGKGGEIQLTDSIRSLLKKEEIYAYEFQGTYYGVGDKIGFLKANVAYALKRKDIGDELKGFLKQIIEEEK